MPTLTNINRRKRRKKLRRQRRNRFRTENVASLKAELELGKPLFYEDKEKIPIPENETREQKKKRIRETPLSYEIDPFPHIKATTKEPPAPKKPSHEQKVAMVTKKYANHSHNTHQPKESSMIDLWSSESSKSNTQELTEEDRLKSFLDDVKPVKKKHYIPSHLKAIDNPHPGESYNPSVDHYLRLLRSLSRKYEHTEREMKRLKSFIRSEKRRFEDTYDKHFFEWELNKREQDPLKVFSQPESESDVSGTDYASDPSPNPKRKRAQSDKHTPNPKRKKVSSAQNSPNPHSITKKLQSEKNSPPGSQPNPKRRRSQSDKQSPSPKNQPSPKRKRSLSEQKSRSPKLIRSQSVRNQLQISPYPKLRRSPNNSYTSQIRRIRRSLSVMVKQRPKKIQRSKSDPTMLKSRKKPSLQTTTKDSDDETKPKRKYIKLKTNAERNKERRIRYERAMMHKRNLNRKRLALFDRIEEIKAKLDEVDRLKKKRKAAATKRRRQKALYGIKNLGPLKYEKLNREILLPEELPTRLSLLKSSSTSLWYDRLDSFRRRNMVYETRIRSIQALKYRRKYVEKYSHKDYLREQEAKYANIESNVPPSIMTDPN